MWLTAFYILLVYCWAVSFFYTRWHVFVLSSAVYALYYVASNSYRDGRRRWSWMRQMRLWDWLRRRYFRHSWHQRALWQDFDTRGRHTYLFIVHPQCYGVASFVAFGLHGQRCQPIRNLEPLVLMGRALFWVPLVTDVLQWAGCVCHDEEYVLDALRHNQSVVWAPMGHGGMMTSHDIEHGVHLQEEALSLGVFEWIVANAQAGVSVVPVYHTGERACYYNASQSLPGWLRSVQAWSHARWGYEWPLPVFGWSGTCLPRPVELRTKVGQPIPVTPGKSARHLRDEFRDEFNKLQSPETGEDAFEIIVASTGDSDPVFGPSLSIEPEL